MPHARPVVRGGTYALTRRTSFRKAFLGAWDPLVADIWLYAMGYWANELGVALHHTMRCVTHGHTTVTPSAANLPKFTACVYEDVSKALNALLAARRYEPPRNLFEDEQPFQMRLLDAEAQATTLVYERVNAVAAGLVRRPQDMPGERFDFGLWKGTPLRVERPPVYFGRWRPRQVEVCFSPPAELYLAFGGDIDALVHHMRRLERDAVRALHRARPGPVLGAKELRRIHPYNEPRTRRERPGLRIPSFKLGAKGVAGRVHRIRACREVRWFREQHRACNEARLRGDDPLYPAGTYKMRVEHGVRIAEPEPDALLTAPGRTLDEVQQLLDEGANPIPAALRLGHDPDAFGPSAQTNEPDDTPAHRILAHNVRAAFEDEATDLVAADRLAFQKPAQAPARPNDATEDVEVQLRTHTRRQSCAPRIVVLRDHRQGRPPRTPRGADPPR